MAAGPVVEVGAVRERIRKSRIERQRPVEAFQRLVLAIKPEQHQPVIGQRARRARIDLERLFDQLDACDAHVFGVKAFRFIEIVVGQHAALLHAHDAQKMQRIKMRRLPRQDLPIEWLRVGEPPLLVQADRLLQHIMSRHGGLAPRGSEILPAP